MNLEILVGLEIFFLSTLFYLYIKYSRNKEIIEHFPRFFQEIYNNISSGMSMVEAVKKSREAYYGRLTPLIRNTCLQVEWGVPLQIALKNLGQKVNNKFVTKVITLTEKASEFSPNMKESIREINDYVSLTKKMEIKRKTELYPHLLSFYLVFFIFLFIIFAVVKLIIPRFSLNGISGYKDIFSHLILIEAVLSGLAIGKITEDSYIVGLKHLILLSSISLIFIYLL